MGDWIEPKINWTSNDRVTYEDMNRIAGNINYIYPAAGLKEDWNTNDIVRLRDWQDILNALKDIQIAISFITGLPTTDISASNFNLVESMIFEMKWKIDEIFRQAPATIYCGQWGAGWYPADPCYNYTRGV